MICLVNSKSSSALLAGTPPGPVVRPSKVVLLRETKERRVANAFPRVVVEDFGVDGEIKEKALSGDDISRSKSDVVAFIIIFFQPLSRDYYDDNV